MPLATDLFTQHSRTWRLNRYVYPVISRRSSGLSIGINLNPDKVCNFDCIYCSVDRTIAPAVRQVDLDILRSELDHMLALAADRSIFREPPFDAAPPALQRLNDVAFSGDGEPTSFARFGDACRLVAEAVQRRGLDGQVKIVLITNATLLHRPAVAEALAYLDQHNGQIWAKLDAGTEPYYRLVEQTAVPLQRVLDNILAAGRLRPIVIQSLFMQIAQQGPDSAEIAAYIQRLRELIEQGCSISLVQVYTVARRPAQPQVAPLPPAALDAIADQVRELGLPASVFYGPG
jgi:wyosine [tRNA(Phe)-imidazoG37] synthetase (radical SAM superfamily)